MLCHTIILHGGRHQRIQVQHMLQVNKNILERWWHIGLQARKQDLTEMGLGKMS